MFSRTIRNAFAAAVCAAAMVSTLKGASDVNSSGQARPSTLPFACDVTQRKLPMLHADLDYPVRQVVIDGDLWMIFVPGRRAYGGKCPEGREQLTEGRLVAICGDGTVVCIGVRYRKLVCPYAVSDCVALR